jgi:hypothetical protein
VGRAQVSNIRTVLIYDQVLASGKHCDNSCQHMSHPQAVSKLATARCDLFDIGLVRNKRKKTHGYIRCSACIRAENLAEEQEL